MNRGDWLQARVRIPNDLSSLFSAFGSSGGAQAASAGASSGAAAVQAAGGMASADVLSGAIGQTGIGGGSAYSSIPGEIASSASRAAMSNTRTGQLYSLYQGSDDFVDFVSKGVEQDLFNPPRDPQQPQSQPSMFSAAPSPQQLRQSRPSPQSSESVVDIISRLGLR